MSAVDILLHSSKDIPLKVSKSEDKTFEKSEDKPSQQTEDVVAEDNAKPPTKSRISYSKEELLELRTAPGSLERPECLSEEFFKDGVWDIGAWHKSTSSSRSASPAVDGSCVTFESGKKVETLDNTIELAPHRRSFCQGCHVQTTNESESKEKESLLKRLGGKAGLGNDSKVGGSDGRERLTARASLRRRAMEKTVLKENRLDGESKRSSQTNFEHRSNEDIRRDQRNISDKREDRRNSKNYREKGRNENDDNKENRRRERDFSHAREEWTGNNLPAWMTDGPSSQTETIELKGFGKEIEEERNAMRRENNNASSKVQTERARKTSKGSSRSSTPSEIKQTKSNGDEGNGKRTRENVTKKTSEMEKDGMQRFTPAEKMLDDNAYFDVMDYLPPHLFADDYTNEASSQSKFSQWFQSQSGSSSDNSRPNSIPLGFDANHMQGFPSKSPTVPLQPYFTPIQPAPPSHHFEHPIAVSPLMDLFPKRKSPPTENSKEVKGRMTLKDIEPELPKPIGRKPEKAAVVEESKKSDLTAFDKLVSSMKAAGQLPEKPAPVVSGLPEHLLPKPPKRTSPSFEKLKRALSRSPSPLNTGRMSPLNAGRMSPLNQSRISPLTFANRQASPHMPPIGERLLSPDFFKPTVTQRSVSPGSFFSEFQDNFGLRSSQRQYQQRPNQDDARNFNFSQQRASFSNGLQTPESFRNSKPQARVPAAFLPTSVIKKMHSEKHEMGGRSEMFADNVLTKLDFSSPRLGPFDATVNKNNDQMQETKLANNVAFGSSQDTLTPHQLIDGFTKTDTTDNPVFAKHPATNIEKHPHAIDKHEGIGRNVHPSDALQGDFNSPGLNVFPGASKVVGAGSSFSKSREEVDGGRRNMVRLNQERKIDQVLTSASSNKPQMFSGPLISSLHGVGNNSRMNHGEIGSRAQGPAMQSRGHVNQNIFQNGSQNQMTNQQNLPLGPPRGPPLPNQQQQQVPQALALPRGRNPTQNNPRLPVAMNTPGALNNVPFNRPTIPAVTAAMAAQFVQQQLLQQAARAHALQAAQAIQQQQQQNLLRTQMQAAMAQAYVRGHAAKAMMYNPRAMATNLQAVAQQMGLRAPQPAHLGKPLPTPLINQQKQEGAKETEGELDGESVKLEDSPLSKWFNVEAMKKTPPAPKQDFTAKGKVISVEDLERGQK